MKPQEYREIREKFYKEQRYWNNLKVGDTIYDEQPRCFDMDYHRMIIDEINIEERQVKAHDAEGDHKATLSYFLTQEEFDKKFRRIVK